MSSAAIHSIRSNRSNRSNSLIASQLLGLAFMRYIWKIEPLATMTEEDLAAAIAPTIQRCVDGDLASAQRPACSGGVSW